MEEVKRGGQAEVRKCTLVQESKKTECAIKVLTNLSSFTDMKAMELFLNKYEKQIHIFYPLFFLIFRFITINAPDDVRDMIVNVKGFSFKEDNDDPSLHCIYIIMERGTGSFRDFIFNDVAPFLIIISK